MKHFSLPLLAATLTALTALAAPAAAAPLVIENATVHLSPTHVLEGASIVIDGAVIKSISKGLRAPAGAEIIDGRGKIVTAGLIDSSTQLGLVEIDSVSEANDGHLSRESDDKVHAAFRVIDGFNWGSVAIPVARIGGVTSAISSPSGSLISGQSAWVRLGSKRSSTSNIAFPAAMIATLGSRSLGGRPSRALVLERLREVLDDAREYRRSKSRYQRNQIRRLAAERLDLEALQAVIGGSLPLIVRANRASDILAAISLKKDGLQIIIEGGAEAWTLAGELAEAKIPVLLDPTDYLPTSFDKIRVRRNAASILAKAGVTIAISTLGSTSSVRRLRQLAGQAVANGLTWQQALDAVTAAPARIFGRPEIGTLAKGGPADLVLWSGDPFELQSRAEAVVIGGRKVPMETRQTLLRDRYRRLPAR